MTWARAQKSIGRARGRPLPKYIDFSSTAKCYGVFAQYRFRCALGEVGRFRERTLFREPVPGFDGFRRRRFEVSMGSDRFRRSEGGSKVWMGSDRFRVPKVREPVPGFDRFRGSESGNAVRRGSVKHPCCWGYHLRLFLHGFASVPVKPLWLAPSELLGPTKGPYAVIYWPCDARKDMSFSPNSRMLSALCAKKKSGVFWGTGSEWQVFRLGEPVLGTGSGFR